MAIAFFSIAVLLIWGGLIASVIGYMRQPEISEYPDGGAESEEPVAPISWRVQSEPGVTL